MVTTCNHIGRYYRALNQSQSSWKTRKEDITPWLLYFLDIIRDQSQQALALLEGDEAEQLLSEKQLELWRWANQLRIHQRLEMYLPFLVILDLVEIHVKWCLGRMA